MPPLCWCCKRVIESHLIKRCLVKGFYPTYCELHGGEWDTNGSNANEMMHMLSSIWRPPAAFSTRERLQSHKYEVCIAQQTHTCRPALISHYQSFTRDFPRIIMLMIFDWVDTHTLSVLIRLSSRFSEYIIQRLYRSVTLSPSRVPFFMRSIVENITYRKRRPIHLQWVPEDCITHLHLKLDAKWCHEDRLLSALSYAVVVMQRLQSLTITMTSISAYHLNDIIGKEIGRSLPISMTRLTLRVRASYNVSCSISL